MKPTQISDHNSDETSTLQPIIQKLEEWKREVDSKKPETVEDQANWIGLSNRIDTAIQLLGVCDKLNVSVNQAKSAVVVPTLVNSCYQPEIRIAEDRETNDPSGWIDLVFPDGKIRVLRGGEIIFGATAEDPRPQSSGD